jgi:hypothetical protein
VSRGLGKLQRSILSALAGDSKVKRADVIAGEIYQTENPTIAQVVATRRAINSLAKSGTVECGEFNSYTGKDDQFDHPIYGLYLFAWLPGNQSDVKPRTRFDSSVVEQLILETLARQEQDQFGGRQGVMGRYDLSRYVRSQLKESYGFDPYLYAPQYNRAFHRLEQQGAIVRFRDEIWGSMIALGRNKLSVATEYSLNYVATLKESSSMLDDTVTISELDYSVTVNEEVTA